jgi:hypothetical protein
MGVYSKLATIQANLKCPKAQYNSFAKFNYRSCEDILEGLKPHLASAGCILTLSDNVVLTGERYYLQATARLVDCETGEEVSATALAHEADGKKGMDESQVTGTASSYARKYALNGMFLIDDTKDADTDEDTKRRQTDGGQKNNAAPPKNQAPPKNSAPKNQAPPDNPFPAEPPSPSQPQGSRGNGRINAEQRKALAASCAGRWGD